MRAVLETIKQLVDEIYAMEPHKWRGVRRMVLRQPASPAAIKTFFTSAPGEGVPESYGELLSASDGVEQGWRRLCFLGTVAARQKPILAVAKYKRDDEMGRFRAFEGEPTPKKIRDWEVKSGELFLAHHPIVATTGEGDLLVYDVHTKRKNGEAELCWWPRLEGIQARYPNIAAYFNAVLHEVERYHRSMKGGRTRKR